MSSHSYAQVRKLCHILPDEMLPGIENVAQKYAISITSDVMKTMELYDPERDPIARQYIPDVRELENTEIETKDPIGDHAHEAVKGLVHRYADRVLFKVTPLCAVYCRFCFRREMVGPENELLDDTDIKRAISYIAEHPEIREVILSGGDPLILSPRRLTNIILEISDIGHIKRIRIHSRMPIAAPSRMTAGVMSALDARQNIYLVMHINHPQEITDEVKNVIERLHEKGVRLLSQSVLLNGVNQDAKILEELFLKLADYGVVPYYLHHPDKAKGTAHFRVTIQEGRDIYRQLRGLMAGYAIPEYVLDIPGGYGKVPINADWIEPHPDGGYTVRDPKGQMHRYYD